MVPDVYGWAHAHNARGVQKYSKHSVEVRPIYKGGITPEIIREFDVIFCFDMYCIEALRKNTRIKTELDKKPIIVYSCGTYFQKPPSYVKVYVVCTERQIRKSKALGIENYALAREGVDTEVFKPIRKHIAWVERVYDYWKNKIDSNLKDQQNWFYGFPYSWWHGNTIEQFLSNLYSHLESWKEPEWYKFVPRFLVGWAGNPGRPIKRYALAIKTKYPIKAMTQYGVKYYIANRSRLPMVNFYNSVDAYIMLMAQNGVVHGVGLTLMEAMSCSLPVVATDIAGVSELVPREWIVPEKPDETVIKEVNEKLTMLDRDRKYLKRVGAANRKLILNTRAWKIRVKDWDRVFEEAAKK